MVKLWKGYQGSRISHEEERNHVEFNSSMPKKDLDVLPPLKGLKCVSLMRADRSEEATGTSNWVT